MKSLEPLQALLGLTERERDAALATTQQAAQALAQQQQQQQQLASYRDEYTERWKQQLRTEASIALLQCYHGFMDRLQAAVNQQEQVVQQAAARLAREQLQLREHELRVASVRKLIERRVAEIHRGIERREQRELDAHAARMVASQPRAWGSVAAASGPTAAITEASLG
jgi:flagellar protein FliJ